MLRLGSHYEGVGRVEPVSFCPNLFLSFNIEPTSVAVTLSVMRCGTVVVVLLGVGTVLTGV